MKVEFVTGSPLRGDGRQLVIQESEFRKADSDRTEWQSLSLAVKAFNSLYGFNAGGLNIREFKRIEEYLDRRGTVYFCVEEIEEEYRPCVFVSNNGIIKEVIFPSIEETFDE